MGNPGAHIDHVWVKAAPEVVQLSSLMLLVDG